MRYCQALISMVSLPMILCCSSAAGGQEVEHGKEARVSAAEIQRGPEFPRIANCYGASVGPGSPAEKLDFVAKYDLLIGGFWNIKWDDPQKIEEMRKVLAHIKAKNPKAIILDFSCSAPYAFPTDNTFPKDCWLLTPQGEYINGWPGTQMTNLSKDEVLHWLARHCKRSADLGFDGTFIDCMAPYFDAWACEIATGKPWQADADVDGKADGRATLDAKWREAKRKLAKEVRERIGRSKVFMANQAGEDNFDKVNGILFEDDLDYVLDAGADWRSVVDRYLHWTRTPSRPTVTTIVSSSGVEPPFDAWKLAPAEQEKLLEKGRSLTQRMRFGLATALLGDGYFAYDLHTRWRGQHWWYPEYDAPLGYPKGEGKEQADGTWRREFDGGSSIVNPTVYDVKVDFPVRRRDVSSGKVGKSFIVPSQDGRIFILTSEKERAGTLPDPMPLFTRDGPETAVIRDGRALMRIGNGWRVHFSEKGVVAMLDLGKTMLALRTAPVIVSTDAWRNFSCEDVKCEVRGETVVYSGRRVENEKAVVFEMKAAPLADGFTLTYDFTAATDVHVHAMRVQTDLSCALFQEGMVETFEQKVTLPVMKGKNAFLAGHAEEFRITSKNGALALRVLSPNKAILRDERVCGGDSYRLSVEFPGGDRKAGEKWHAEITFIAGK